MKKIVRTGTALEITVYIDGVYEHRYKALVGISTLSPQHQNNYFVMDGRSRIATVRLGDRWGEGSDTDVCYNLEDHLGTSTMRLDTNGTPIDREEYYPFGDSSLRTIDKKRYRYVGKERDEESGLYYYGARYYAAWTCRFVSVDPLADKYPHLTPYNYASNRPIGDLDLEGLQTPSEGEAPTYNPRSELQPSASDTPAQNPTVFRVEERLRANPEYKGPVPPPEVSIPPQYTGKLFNQIVFPDYEPEQHFLEERPQSLASKYKEAANSLISTDHTPNGIKKSILGIAMHTSYATAEQAWGFLQCWGGPGPVKNFEGEVMGAQERQDAFMNTAFLSLGPLLAEAGLISRGATVVRNSRAAGVSVENAVAGTRLNVNPTGGRMNCVNCSIAMDAQLAGRPSCAMRGKPEFISVLEETFSSQFKPVTGATEITDMLLSRGPGSRGIVYGYEQSGEVGHVWNVMNQKGVVRFFDAQSGAVGREALANFNDFTNFAFMFNTP